MANLFDTGGALPQTATPFSMDLSAPIMAITQQMVKTRRQEIADDKSEQARNEDLMLKAMDFETVQGLSDKVQEEHIKKLDEFQTQGAEMMARNRGLLSDADKMKIVRQKRQIDSEINSMKSNVLSFESLRKELVKQQTEHPYDSYLDLDATAKNMTRWEQEGNIGKSPMGLMVVRQRQPAEIVEGMYGNQLKELKNRTDKTIAGLGDNKPAIYNVVTDYQKQVDAFKNNVLASNPAFKNIMPEASQYVDAVYGGKGIEEKFMPGYGRKGSGDKDSFSGDISPYTSSVNANEEFDKAFVVQKAGIPINVSYTDKDSGEVTSAKIVPLGLRPDGMLEAKATVETKKSSAPMSEIEAQDFKATLGSGTIIPSGDQFKVVYSEPSTKTIMLPYESDTRTKLAKLYPGMERYYESLGSSKYERKSKESMNQIEARIKKENQAKYGTPGTKRYTLSSGQIVDIPLSETKAFETEMKDKIKK